MEVIDLFCGVGGFSWGHSGGGTSDPGSRGGSEDCPNVPQQFRSCNSCGNPKPGPLGSICETTERTPERTSARFPPVKNCHRQTRPPRRREGLRLVDFYLQLVERARPKTWSMEQVNNPPSRRYLNKRGVEFVVVNTSDFDVPQSRRRIVAGSSHVVLVLRLDVAPDPPSFRGTSCQI